jgi:hypothetical protein
MPLPLLLLSDCNAQFALHRAILPLQVAPCRYHRTPLGLANLGITMFKNPTAKFQMFKGTDRSEGARGAAPATARLRVTARSPAFLDTITCFAKVSAETFVAGVFSA